MGVWKAMGRESEKGRRNVGYGGSRMGWIWGLWHKPDPIPSFSSLIAPFLSLTYASYRDLWCRCKETHCRVLQSSKGKHFPFPPKPIDLSYSTRYDTLTFCTATWGGAVGQNWALRNFICKEKHKRRKLWTLVSFDSTRKWVETNFMEERPIWL